VAAPLAVCAELLAVPVEDLTAAAATVEPYRRADGEPVWSVHLLGLALGRRRSGWQTRRERSRRGRTTRQRKGRGRPG
jgi:hypothetical protein